MFTFFYSLFDLRSFLSSPNTLFSASVRYGRKIRAKSFRRIPLAFVGGMICPKKVWLGFILLAILVRFPTLAFRVPCLLRSSRQCRSHCYCLLDWNAHAHQTLNACRAIAPLGHRTQIVHSPWPPFLLSPLPLPFFAPLWRARFFSQTSSCLFTLHYTCSSRRHFGLFLLLVGGCNTLIVDCWLDLRGR